MVSLLTHICVTGPQWVNCIIIGIMEWISNYIHVKQLYVITHHSCFCFCIAISAHIRMNTSAFLALYSDLCFISPISSILSHCPSDTYTWRNSFWLWTLWGQHSTVFFWRYFQIYSHERKSICFYWEVTAVASEWTLENRSALVQVMPSCPVGINISTDEKMTQQTLSSW